MRKYIIAIALGCTVTVAAEETATNVSDEGKMVELQEVQVASVRATKNTPVVYTDIKKTQIQELNHGKDVPSLLSLTPSVTITSDAGNGIGYTSMRVRGSDPNRINVTANGIPLNDAESSTLFWVNFGDIASSAQSIQLQRGVGTSTNGAGAFGATLNIQTDNIGSSPMLGIDLSGGSYASNKETLRFGSGLWKEHWGIQGRLSHIGTKGYLDRADADIYSYFVQCGYFSDNTMVKFITFNGWEETKHAWNYASKYEQSLYGRRYNSCGIMSYDADGNPKSFYDNQTDNYNSQNYQLILNQRLGKSFSLNAALHYTHGRGYYEEYSNNYGYGEDLYYYGLAKNPGSVSSDLIRQLKMKNDFYGVIASINYKPNNTLAACLGGGWNRYEGKNYGLVTWVDAPLTDPHHPEYLNPWTEGYKYYDTDARKNDFNIYGKVNYEFMHGLNAYIDLQYRHVGYHLQDPRKEYGHNDSREYILRNMFDFFNPKFGINYSINRNHKVYASYAIANKEPVRNNYETYMSNKHIGLPRSERLYDLEVGYKYSNNKFSAGINGYYMRYKDQLVLTGEKNEIGEQLTRNVPDSYRLGVEIEAAWQPVKWLRWDGNATLSRNRVKDIAVTLDDGTPYIIKGETPLSFSPDCIVNSILSFTHKDFRASLQTQYVSSQYLNNTGFKEYIVDDADGGTVGMTIGGHCTTTLNLDYTFRLPRHAVKEITAGIALYNIFNKEYDTNGWSACAYRLGSDGKLQAYYTDRYMAGFAPAAPFNFMAHVSVNF